MNADFKSILWNVVGGVLVSLLTSAYFYSRHRLRSYHLQRLIGFSFKPRTEVRITYGQLFLAPQTDYQGNLITHPYLKAPRIGGAHPLEGTYSIQHPVSERDVRASTYMASLFGTRGTLRPLLVSDTEADALLDSNFVSLGGPGSNYKTADILASHANIFIRMSHEGFTSPSGEALPSTCDGNIDHGFILRVSPPEFPEHSWIVCAGLGEWGTSGSAWYLARRWKNLARSIHPFAYRSGFMAIPDFLAIIRVTCGQDQSARMERIYRNVSGQSRRIK
jgi:hypothetical protein